jgi:predicted MFS family arabinose efflux permease
MGPILFAIDPKLPWYLISGLWFLSVIIILFMVEPDKEKQEYTFKNYMKKIGDGLKFIIREKHVLWMMFFVIAMTVPLGIFNEIISQSYFYEIGFAQKDMSWIFPLIYGLASLTASQSHRLEKLFGENGSFIFIVVIHSIGLLLMGLLKTPYTLIVVAIVYISRDFRWVFGDSYLNKYAESNIRTTILSIITMAVSLVMTFSYTLGGYMVDKLLIPKTLLILGIVTIVCSIMLIALKPKNNKKENEELLESVDLSGS